jgi:pyrimidine operon attenuation protein/uracil phosphoribosyltransferase
MEKRVGNPEDVQDLIESMAQAITAHLHRRAIEQPAMVGIHTGGVWVARALHKRLGLREPLGSLDISFYRDDFTRIGMNPQVRPSELPFNVDDRHIILVDDVLHTGRTIRAALNELFDYGRPASIMLAVLVERSGRELPIEANVVGRVMELAPGQHVKLTGPDPMTLEIQQIS